MTSAQVSVKTSVPVTNNPIHFIILLVNRLYHGEKNNMVLRHLQFLTLVRQSTGNRRLDI